MYLDHKPLASITKKPLDRAFKHIQGKLMRVLAYDIEVRYLNGEEMYLTDVLSRAHLPRTSSCGKEEFETINGLSYLIMLKRRFMTSIDTPMKILAFNS